MDQLELGNQSKTHQAKQMPPPSQLERREKRSPSAQVIALVLACTLLASLGHPGDCSFDFSFASFNNKHNENNNDELSKQLDTKGATGLNNINLDDASDETLIIRSEQQLEKAIKLHNEQQSVSSNCDSLASCINQLVLASRLIKEPLTYFMADSDSSDSGEQKQPQLLSKENLNSKSPVIFVPGDGGSQLEARLNKTYRVHYFCSQNSDWYSIWLNVNLLAPLVIDCFYDNFRLHFEPSTGLTRNTPGVEIRARDFGSLEPVAYLDPLHMPKTDYFETLIRQLERSHNLARDVDMAGASFDFRRAPNELGDWLANLTHLIERKYVESNYRRVTLICHSMGCMNAVYLLNQKTLVWKELFIRRLVALASPWAGSFKAISAMLFGDTLGIPLLDAKKLRVLQASWPSLMYLFPRELAFAPNQTLVQTPDFNYTLDTLDGLFLEANLTEQRAIWHQTREIAASLEPPQVELWCLAGSDVPTPVSLSVGVPLEEAIHSLKYEEQMGDGDGTVNIESSNVCLQWAKEQPRDKPVYLRKFPGIDHISMARDPRPAQFIAETIMARDDQLISY